MSHKTETIRVVIRCRPLSEQEMRDQRQVAVKMVHSTGEILVQKPGDDAPKVFTFDSVYDWNSEQETIFTETAYPIIDFVLQGYNGTMFAYGQTGTGKTFTINGVPKDPKLKGIMPRSFEAIFHSIECDSSKEYLVRASYLEIYNEEIRDLLYKNGQKKLELKDKDTGVYVKDLSTFVVKSPADLMDVFNEGNLNRHVGATNMNEHSSRSHSVFTITVESSQLDKEGKAHIKVGKLNIVDLAGSERQSKTGATGERLKEATKINLSLSTLCHVISSLTDPKCTYIPYRDSKLTRILQDSLGGNTKTVMIANCGPADYNTDETVSTLRYASRAKNIENKPRINEDPKDAMIREFHDEITRLRAELEKYGGAQMPTQMRGPDGQIIVEKVVHVDNSEKMKAMEDALEKEKEEIREKYEKEKEKIMQQTEMDEADRQKLMDELSKKEEAQQKEKSKKQKLLKKIKGMEEKLLRGSEAMEEAMKQEQELLKTKSELEAKRREQVRIAQELKQKQEQKLTLQKYFNSQQEELEIKSQEIDKVQKKMNQVRSELEDMQEVVHREREDLMDRIRELTREIKMKHLVIDQFIPSQEYMRIEKRAEWDEDTNDWIIPNVEYTGNNIKIQKARKKEGKAVNNLLFENILNLDGESEEEDFEQAATKRVNEAINSILIDDEEAVNLVPPEKQSVFFRYTEEGAVREDPEEAAKKEKNKKKRLASAKRPLTAKKKKVDIATVDVVNMVQSMSSQQKLDQNEKKNKKQIFPKAQGFQ